MTRQGIAILCCFAPFWLILARFNGASISWAWVALGGFVSVLLIWLSRRSPQEVSQLPPTEQRRIGRVFMWSSFAEGIGILVAINALDSFGIADRNMAAIALVVGLHFIPIGFKVPMKVALYLALLLMILGVVGFLVPSPQTAALFVGGSGAVILWIAACCAMLSLNRRSNPA